ncbi:unnamed protein product [Urochloa humidicola]
MGLRSVAQKLRGRFRFSVSSPFPSLQSFLSHLPSPAVTTGRAAAPFAAPSPGHLPARSTKQRSVHQCPVLGPPLVFMAPAPALSPSPATDVECGGGHGARNQSSMTVLKTGAICTNRGPVVVAPDIAGDQGCDTSECSSSFGGTTSGFEGEFDEGEPEVNSVISAPANGGGSSKLPRRKKVTDEWRNYVRPILWRCQWLELQMKELLSQVSVYDRELALIKKEKELQQEVCKANGSMSESIEIYEGYGNSIMKRRKRKSHEKNVDASLYINKHQILSYYHDNQNTGAETGLSIDDDCGNTVDGSIGGLDAVTLLKSENYNMVFEQLTLKYTLMTIDGLQSRVHLLQDLLSKAHSGGENLALSEDNAHVRVPWKRRHTQKCSFSHTKCQYTKPQKRKYLNISLMGDDGSALGRGPPLSGREIDAHIKDANRNAEERSGEHKHLREKAVTVGQLLGTNNSIPNGHIGDLCKENTGVILIDNQVARKVCQQFDKAKHLPCGTSSKVSAKMKNISALADVKNTCPPVETDSTSTPGVEPTTAPFSQNTDFILTDNQVVRAVCQQFDKAKHLPSGTSSKGPAKMKNISALADVKNTCPPVEADSTSTPGVEPISPQSKQELKPKKKRKKGSLLTMKKRKETSKTPAAKEKTEGAHSAVKNKTGSTPSSVAVKNTESMPSGATGPGTMAARSAGKRCKAENGAADSKKRESAALKKQETGKPSSAAKKNTGSTPSSVTVENTESMPSDATGPGTMTGSTGKKCKAENEPADAKKRESAASKKRETWKPSSAAKNQKAENPFSAAKKQKTGSTPSSVTVENIESMPSGATGQGTMTARSTGKKRKAENEPADAKICEFAALKQETGKPSSAAKKQKTESLLNLSATKKWKTENTPSATKGTESVPLNLKVEKAAPVAVKCRRSQRVRKPKLFAD